ncbi:MAG: hypothetical protein M3Y50_03315 [Acidobacteriota bacterium]|nr:hypothetical protein [Acidobacteriota bacterium]
MSTEQPKRGWDQPLRDATTHLEDDLKKVVTYINDEVVPAVRRNGSEALRAAAAEFHRMAQKMDDHARRSSSGPPPPPPGPGEPQP